MAMLTLLKAWHNLEKEVVLRVDMVTMRGKKRSLIKDSTAGHLADTLI